MPRIHAENPEYYTLKMMGDVILRTPLLFLLDISVMKVDDIELLNVLYDSMTTSLTLLLICLFLTTVFILDTGNLWNLYLLILNLFMLFWWYVDKFSPVNPGIGMVLRDCRWLVIFALLFQTSLPYKLEHRRTLLVYSSLLILSATLAVTVTPSLWLLFLLLKCALMLAPTVALGWGICLRLLRLLRFYGNYIDSFFLLTENVGPLAFLEYEWRRLQVPTLLRVFWTVRFLCQAVYVFSNLLTEYNSDQIDRPLIGWIVTELLATGCDSLLSVLGMSAMTASVAGVFDDIVRSVLQLSPIKAPSVLSTGSVAAICFFTISLVSNIWSETPSERILQLLRVFSLILTAVLTLIHTMVNSALESLTLNNSKALSKHFRVVGVCGALFIVPAILTTSLWCTLPVSTWLLIISACCIEIMIKSLASLVVYTLSMIDASNPETWENLDDYIYYVHAFEKVCKFLNGLFLLANGVQLMFFEPGGILRAIFISMHAYFNIWVQARSGWNLFKMRIEAVRKIKDLPEASEEQLSDYNDVCSVCYQLMKSARVTPCNHYFHAVCLRKWLYVHEKCPLCHCSVIVQNST